MKKKREVYDYQGLIDYGRNVDKRKGKFARKIRRTKRKH